MEILRDLGVADTHLCPADRCNRRFSRRLIPTEYAPLIFIAVALTLLVRRHAVAYSLTHPTNANLNAAPTTMVVARPIQRIILAIILLIAE